MIFESLLGVFFQEAALFLFTGGIWLAILIDALIQRRQLTIRGVDLLAAGWVLLFAWKGDFQGIGQWVALSLVLCCWGVSRCRQYKWIWGMVCLLGMLNVAGIYRDLSEFQPHRWAGWTGNAGSFANLLLPFVCIAGGCWWKQRFEWRSGCVFGIGILLLMATFSRAAWLGCLIGMVYILSCGWNIPVRKKIQSLLVILFIISGIVMGLYWMRPDSADGRMLIYRVCAEYISSHPQGCGLAGFSVEYLNQQSLFFQEYPDSEYVQYASETKAAFNELLQVGFELGVLGILLFIGTVIYLLRLRGEVKYRWQVILLKSVLLALLVSSCFSYPLRELVVCFQIMLFLGLLASYEERIVFRLRFPQVCRGACVGLMGIFFCFLTVRLSGRYQAYLTWDRIDKGAFCGTDKMELYRTTAECLDNEGLFLYHYGLDLSFRGHWDKSDTILWQAAGLYNGVDIWLCLGRNAKMQGRYQEAGVYFLKAYHMAPLRFKALYELMKLYSDCGEEDQAHYYASFILHKKIKISSPEVGAIRREAQIYLSK